LGRDIRRSTVRHFTGRVFATVASVVLRLPVYDTQCGAKLFRVTPRFKELISEPFGARWVFDVEILARMLHQAQSTSESFAPPMIYEYPLEEWRDVDGSRLMLLDFVIAGIDLAAIYWRYRRRSMRYRRSTAAANSRVPILDETRRDAA
jgi:dolichyl-phosphate beta-glucosyltransferase